MPPPPPPPPAPPPGFGSNRAPPPKKATADRGALLSDIRGGMKLKKTVTNDRSAPVIAGNTNSVPTIAKPTVPRRSNALNKRLREMLESQPTGKTSVSSSSSGGGDRAGGANGAGDRPQSVPGFPANNLGALIAGQASRLRSVSHSDALKSSNGSGPMRAPAHNAFSSSSNPVSRVPPPPPQNTKPASGARTSMSGPPGTSLSPRPFAPPPSRRPVSVYSQRPEPNPEPIRPAISTSQIPFRSPDSGYSPSPQGWRRSPSCGNVADPQPPPLPPPLTSRPNVTRAQPPPIPPNKPPVKAHAPMPPALPSRQRPPSFCVSSSYSQPHHEYANGQVGGEPVLRRHLSSSTSALSSSRPPPPPPPRTSRPPPPPPGQPMRSAPRPPSEVYDSRWEVRFAFRPMGSLPPPPMMKVSQKRYPSQRCGPRNSVYDRRQSAPHPPARPPR